MDVLVHLFILGHIVFGIWKLWKFHKKREDDLALAAHYACEKCVWKGMKQARSCSNGDCKSRDDDELTFRVQQDHRLRCMLAAQEENRW